MARGLVSTQEATRYGVALHADGTVDPAATQALRARLRGSRAPLGVFDRGPDIDALRARCLAQTGLPAPLAPGAA